MSYFPVSGGAHFSSSANDMTMSRIRSGFSSVTMTFLWREASPLFIITDDLGTEKSSERNSLHARFASPSTGGEVSAIRSAFPWIPVTRFRDARGWIWRFIDMHPFPRAHGAELLTSITGKHPVMAVQKRFKAHLELHFLPFSFLYLTLELSQPAL